MWNTRFFTRVRFSDVDSKIQILFWFVMMGLYYLNYLTRSQEIAIRLTMFNLIDIPIAMLHFFVLLPLTLGNSRLSYFQAYLLWALGLISLAFINGGLFSFLSQLFRDNFFAFGIFKGVSPEIVNNKVIKEGIAPQNLEYYRNIPEAIFSMLSFTAVLYASRFSDLKETLEERNEKLFLQKVNADLEIEQLRQKQVMKDKELEFLRVRIDHHTLFNALDSIYFAAKKKRDTTPEITLKLKELMRYLVRDDDNKVSLARDFEVLQCYVDLKKLELEGATVDIQFNLPIEYDKRLRIAPMILLVFVENVFKHGIEKVSENRYGRIDIRIEGNQLFLETVNPNPKRNVDTMDDTGGKGIALTRRRLKRIYPDRHEFTRIENKEIFKLNLQIELDYE